MHFVPVNLDEVAILLDVDGTLLDISPTPRSVHAPASLRRTLARLWARSGGALALVSGRPLEELDRIFAPLRLPAVGGHGAELRIATSGHAEQKPAAHLDSRIKRQLVEWAEAHPGILVEDKGYSLALHYRLAPEREQELRGAIATIGAKWAPRSFEVLQGKAVLEIKPPGFDKGTALHELMAVPPFHARRPLFVGDDKTDEAAFEALRDYDGIGISIGRMIPGVVTSFQTPRDLRWWLDRISHGDGHDSI